MAYEDLGKCVSIPANADLSSYQYCFVSINSSGYVAVTGDGLEADGILQDDPAAQGRPAQVMVGAGISKIKVAGVVTKGDNVASDSAGRATTAVSGDRIMGVALETSTTANQIIAMLFKPGAAAL